jgi:hypothetical protein
LSQPAWPSLSPVAWDYPWNACNFLSSITRVPALSMNWKDHITVRHTAYEMLSTGLFTGWKFYSHRKKSKKPNVYWAFARFKSEVPDAFFPPKSAVVDKFSLQLTEKSAKRREKLKNQAAGAAAADFFFVLTATFLRLRYALRRCRF